MAMRLVVDPAKCRASGECLKVCPQGAISIVEGVAVIDQERCDFDGICIPACPHQAIDFSDD